MMNTFYLVNVVHNDYHHLDGIFEPFFETGVKAQVVEKPDIQTNGNAFDKLTNGIHAITITSSA